MVLFIQLAAGFPEVGIVCQAWPNELIRSKRQNERIFPLKKGIQAQKPNPALGQERSAKADWWIHTIDPQRV